MVCPGVGCVPSPVFPYDEALRLARAVGVDLDKDIVGSLANKKGSDLTMWDSVQRANKGALGSADGSSGMIDALHHAAYQGRTKTLESARELLERAGIMDNPNFRSAMQAILEVLPVGTAFSGVELPTDVAGAGNDFEAIEKLRRLAFADQVEEPQQLSLWQQYDNMSLLCDREWKLKYTPDDGDLVTLFYVPALECAVRYDRLTGYFRARALMLAARGLEGLIRNGGRMRLLVGCTLDQPEVDAIAKGAECRDQVKAHLLANPLKPGNQREVEALELLAWMVANQFLEVQVAVPCDEHHRPIPAQGIFHEKAGIIEDKTGDRLAFNGSLNETEAGWTQNWESLNIFRSWLGDDPRVDAEETNFAKLWAGDSKHVITMSVLDALRDDLLRFLPENDLPARLKKQEVAPSPLPPEPIAPPLARARTRH